MQSRKSSFFEVLYGTAFAFCISALVQQFIVNRIWGFHASLTDNLAITSLFTAVSLIRSYWWRRFFNWLDNKNKKAANETHRNHREGARG